MKRLFKLGKENPKELKNYDMRYDLTDYNDSSKSKRCSLPITAYSNNEAIEKARDYCESNDRRILVSVWNTRLKIKIFGFLVLGLLCWYYFSKSDVDMKEQYETKKQLFENSENI